MKIIGPCAGIGSRLRPFTLSKPKAFINIAGKTVLEHILDKFSKTFDSNIELILIVGYKKKQITNFVKKKYSDKFQLTFIEQIPRGYNDSIPFYWGLGEAVYLAHKRFKKLELGTKKEDKREGSLIFLADMIPIVEYSYLMYRYYESDVDGIITVIEVPKENASSYGVVTIDEKSIIRKLVEKPKEFVSNLAIAGIYAFSNSATHALFRNIKKYIDNRKEDSKEIYLTESLQDLVNSGYKIAAVNLKQGILDFGRPSEVLNGNRYLLEQKSTKKEDFPTLNITVEKSFIKNPIHIGNRTSIINSVIGPHVSIGKNSFIQNSILKNCVIEKSVKLNNIISENSIIGSNVKVENISKDNLIIGDKSIF
ncbi:MAG: sugar phosphate nucleotidyltransferase [Candidatus Hodarchaeota archaeon]